MIYIRYDGTLSFRQGHKFRIQDYYDRFEVPSAFRARMNCIGFHSTFNLQSSNRRLALYTILPSPILYGVWHEKGGSVGGRILHDGCAIVLQ